MSLDIAAGEKPPAPLPIQYVNIEIMPIIGGRVLGRMQATLLDEEALEFVGQDLANERVEPSTKRSRVIRQNVGALVLAAWRWS